MKKKFKNFYFFLIKSFFDLIYANLKLANNNFVRKNIKVNKIKLSKYSNKNFIVYEISKSRVYSDNSQNVAVIKKKFLIPKLSTQIKDNCLIEANKNAILKSGTRKFLQKKITGNILSLVQGASGIHNYGHWMLDILPKLCIAEKFKNLNLFDGIYLPNINYSFQKDTLKYFKISNKKFIDGSKIRHIYANKLTIPKHPYWILNKDQGGTADIDPDIIKILRNKFLKKVKKYNKKKIFIDRSDSKFFHSQIENYHEVLKVLRDHDFEIIKLVNMPFKDQVSYFHNAKIIFGAHGAGLCNVIFSNPKTKLIEIRHQGFKGELLKNISKINKVNYHRLTSSPKLPLGGFKPDIYVPIKKLIKLIR